MKRFVICLLLISSFIYSGWAINPIKIGSGEITPFLDAEQQFDNRWGGAVDYDPHFTLPPEAEGGIRYEKDNKNSKIYSNFSLTNAYNSVFTGVSNTEDSVKIGQMNIGISMDNTHNFTIGRGTYPFGITMRNSHFNNRIEVWAPITLAIFSYNIIGEYKEGFIYEYINSNYRLKFAGLQDEPYLIENGKYTKKAVIVPIADFSMNLTKNLETELTYAHYQQGDARKVTFIGGLAYNFPKDLRCEFEYINHRNFNAAFSLLESPDNGITVNGVPNVLNYYIDNFTYQSLSFIVKKKFYPKDHRPFTIYGELFALDTRSFFILETSMYNINVPINCDYLGNQTKRIGLNYELTDEISWAIEYEHNTIDVGSQWKHRVCSAIRLRF